MTESNQLPPEELQEMLDDMLAPQDMAETDEEKQPAQGQQEVDVAALQAALAEADARHEEDLNRIARAQADYENFRRRNETVRADAYAEGSRRVIAAMLPVLDNLERALEAAGEESPLKTGVALTLRTMTDALEKLGVTVISRQGEPFDPNLEEAVLQGTEEEGEPGTVCAVLQKGYALNGTVIRHAMVKVVAG